MTPVRILVDSLADRGLSNSQMTNAREIIQRLDSDRFHVSVFCGGEPDRSIEQRPNTRLVRFAATAAHGQDPSRISFGAP